MSEIKKKSAYFKLKEENTKLKAELMELVANPDSSISMEIKLRYSIYLNLEKAIWAGDTRTSYGTTG